MPYTWTEATKQALQHFSIKNNTIVINRRDFILQELGAIVQSTESTGQTPAQTLSRVLQELRDEQFLFFSQAAGEYTLNRSVSASQEDLPDDVLENAIDRNELRFEEVSTNDAVALQRVRKGTQKLRSMTLQNYRSQCALCDIRDTTLLVTSHIVPWAQDVLIRGHLDNVICLCTLHDKLFELGYFSLKDDYHLIWRDKLQSTAIDQWKSQCTSLFNRPLQKHPTQYLWLATGNVISFNLHKP